MWAIIVAAILVFAASSTARGQLQVDSYAFSISHHEVSDLFFLNSSAGWMVLADHDHGQFYLFNTVDEGQTWTRRKVLDGVFRIWFISNSLGYALRQVNSDQGSEQVYLLRTENGGQAWASVSPLPVTSQAQTAYSGASLAFLDGLHGWFVGSSADSPVLETSDGGVTTHAVRNARTTGDDQQVNHIFARRGQGVWMYGIGFVWHSINLGNTWTNPVNLRALQTNPYAFDALDIDLLRDGYGWLVGDDPYGMILKTVDFGRHWKRVREDQEISNFWSVSFWDKSNGCATGDATFLVCTRDGGETWSTQDVLPPAKGNEAEFFSKLVLLKSGRGWLLRAGGYLYKTDDRGKTWQEFDPLNANE